MLIEVVVFHMKRSLSGELLRDFGEEEDSLLSISIMFRSRIKRNELQQGRE